MLESKILISGLRHTSLFILVTIINIGIWQHCVIDARVHFREEVTFCRGSTLPYLRNTSQWASILFTIHATLDIVLRKIRDDYL